MCLSGVNFSKQTNGTMNSVFFIYWKGVTTAANAALSQIPALQSATQSHSEDAVLQVLMVLGKLLEFLIL